MDLDALDLAFREKTEVEVVRLLTCNFDPGAFSLVEEHIHPKLVGTIRDAIKFRTHLSMDSTTLDGFVDKIKSLSSRAEAVFEGSVSRLCGYSGKLLTNTKTVLGTPEELVSPNEFAYVIKIYPWWMRPVNPAFAPYVDQYVDKQAFFCLSTFDIYSLSDKEDVALVTEDYILFKNKLKLPVIRVD